MGTLLEDHGKALLAAGGVPVPDGRVATSADEAAEAARALGGPVAVKALVPVGKRAEGGGIRFADGAAQAGLEASSLLARTVHGCEVRRVLVESRLDVGRELYLSVAFDSVLRLPLVLLSSMGGGDVESLAAEMPDRLVRVPVDEHLVSHRVREGWREAGLTGPVLEAATDCAARAVSVFYGAEARLLEINPLAVTRDRKVVALDAVVVLDEASLPRHPELRRLVEDDLGQGGRPPTRLEREIRRINDDPSPGVVRLTEFPEGVIGCMVSGGGGGLLCLDLMDSLGVRPMNTFDITPGPVERKMYLAARAILSEPRVRGLIVGSNITNFNRADVKVRAVVRALEDEGVDPGRFPVVIRLTGPGAEEAREVVRRLPGLRYHEDEVTLEDAVRDIVRLVHGAGGRG